MKDLFGEIDDHTALRFLRARQFDVKNASNLYRNDFAYRKESGIEKIVKSDVPKSELFRKFIPHAYHGFDRVLLCLRRLLEMLTLRKQDGRPVYIEKVGVIDYPTAMTVGDLVS